MGKPTFTTWPPRGILEPNDPPGIAESGITAPALTGIALVRDNALGNRGVDHRGVAGEMSERVAFDTLDRDVRNCIYAISSGIDNIPNRLATMTPCIQFSRQMLQAPKVLRRDAANWVAVGLLSTSPEARKNAFEKAGGLYGAAMICNEALALLVNAYIVWGYADAAGVNSDRVSNMVKWYQDRILPMFEVIHTPNADMRVASRARFASEIQMLKEKLARETKTIETGEFISRKVIQALDIFSLACSIYHVYRTPTIKGPPNSSTLPKVVIAYANGTASMTRVGQLELTATLEAIKKLIAIGALNPSLVGLLGASVGTAISPIPEWGRPQLLESSIPNQKALAEKPNPKSESAPKPTQKLRSATPTPKGLNRVLVALQKSKVDINDPYTLEKIGEIYARNRNPEALLMHIRAGNGELRVLIRHGSQPGVKIVRFVPTSNKLGEVTPDIEIHWKNKTVSYVECKTFTQSAPYLKRNDATAYFNSNSEGPNSQNSSKYDKARSPLAVTDESFENIDSKLRHGQISDSRPGVYSFHAPFQTVTEVSLDGWRGIIEKVMKRGRLSKGVKAIEVSGGTGPILIFNPANKWMGKIIK